MRIVEGSAFVAAPLGGMAMAQLGADVIRFDPIGGGLDRSEMFEEVEQPGIGTYVMPGSPLDFSAAERLPPRRAPLLGEHTDEVLTEVLGLSDAEIGPPERPRRGGRGHGGSGIAEG